MPDFTAPKLTRLSIPTLIDVSAGQATFTVSAGAEDQLDGSGVDTVTVFLDNKLGYTYGAYNNFSIPEVLGADTFKDSTPTTASAALTLTNATAPGTYHVNQVWVTDRAGNRATYTEAQLTSLGIQTTFQVTGGKSDTVGPTLVSLDIPAIIDVSSGQRDVMVTVQALDNPGGAGVSGVTVFLDNKLAYTYGSYSNFSIPELLGADTFADSTPTIASTKLTLTNVTAPGTYHVTKVWVTDLAGNQTTYTEQQLASLGIRTSFEVAGGKADKSAPKLLALSIPTVDLTVGAKELVANVQATDGLDGSGIDSVTVFVDKAIGFTYGAGTNFTLPTFLGSDTFKDSTPDTASAKFALADFTPAGTYHITQVRVTDMAGNQATYTAQQLASLGIRTSFDVTAGKPPVPDATVEVAAVAGDDIVLKIKTNSWSSSDSNSFSLRLTYDAAHVHYKNVTVSGASASSLSSQVTETGAAGTLVVNGQASPGAPAGGTIEVTLHAASPGQFSFALTGLTVNGGLQTLASAAAGKGFHGAATADLIANAETLAFIDGGTGLDVARFSGSASSYNVTKTATGFDVTSSTGAVSHVLNVERLAFSDQSLALDIDGSGGALYRLYQAAFDRQPDAAGIGYWMHQVDSGTTMWAAANAFIGSPEFASKYGANISAETFLAALYQNVLHRAPDKAGYDYWLGVLHAGTDRATILTGFSESAENVAQVIGTIQNGFAFTPWS